MSNQQYDDIETFDDSDTDAGPEQGALDEGELEQGESKKEVKPEKITQKDQLEDQDDSNKKKAEEDKKDDKEDPESDDKDKEEEPKKEMSRKQLKAILDGKEIDVDPLATFTTKVDGKNKTVSVRELLDTHSGHTSLDKRFAEYKNETRKFSKERAEFGQQREFLTSHLNKISNILDDDRKDPMEALYYLLDMSGRDPIEYHKRALSHRQEEFRSLDEMTEAEADLYWTRKELESTRAHQQSKAERLAQQQAQEARAAQAIKSREAQGVSEEQFEDARAELNQLGYKENELTPDKIASYAKFMPFIAKAESITEPYQADLDDSDFDALTSGIANTLMSFPHFTEEEALIATAKKIGLEVEDDNTYVENINRKPPVDEKIKKRKDKYNGKIESEEDIEEFDFYNDDSY